MPIPILQWPMPTFQQANPWAQGVQTMQGLQQQAIQNQYLAPMMQARLRQMALQAQQTPVQTQLMREQAQLYTPQTLSEIAARRAQTALTQEQARFMPLEDLTKAMQTAQTGTRFGPAYQLSRVLNNMDKPSRDQWIANNQDAYNTMVDSLGNAAIQQQTGGGTPSGPLGMAIQRMFPQYFTQQQPGVTPTAQPSPQPSGLNQQQADLLRTPSDQLTPAQKEQKLQLSTQNIEGPGPQFGVTPQQTQQMQLQNQYNANRNTLSDKMKTQQDFAVRAEQFLRDNRKEFAGRINNILEYAGARGRGTRYFQTWANENPDKLSDFDWYQNTFSPGMANILRQIESMGATDQQQTAALNMLNQINNISGNPARAKMAINKSINLIRELADSTFKASEPINKGITRQLYNLPKESGDYVTGGAQPAATGRISVVAPDGRRGTIPAAQLQDAISQGYKRAG